MPGLSVLVVSDVHDEVQALGFLSEFLDGVKPDLLVACGDVTNRGPVSFAEDFVEFARQKGVELLVVHGNMDPLSVRDFFEKQGVSIHGKTVEFKGFKFAGFGGSGRTPNNTPCEYSEDEIASGLKGLEVDEKTVLVCHTPPFGTKADELALGLHIGSKSVRDFVEKKQPFAVLCGHAHETQGEEFLGKTKVVKVGPLMRGKTALLELPSLKVEFLSADRKF